MFNDKIQLKMKKTNHKAKLEDLKTFGALFIVALLVMHGVRLMIISTIY
jgi:hypothetical protein